jgi:4,5-dihydroxyphthalate decarboxylase
MSDSIDIVLGRTPQTKAILAGTTTVPGVSLRVHDLAATPHAFKRFVRHQDFAFCELALVTYLQAIDHGKPIRALPIAMLGRLPLNQVLRRADRDDIVPAALAGLRIGVRSWTKTSGVWVRAILADAYGFDPRRAHWVSFEDPHVAEYTDPSARAPAGCGILDMLSDGRIDLAIGETSDDPRFRPLFPDPIAAIAGWRAAHRFVPINHVMVATEAVLRARPGIAARIHDLIVAGRDAAGAADGPPIGLAAMRPALDWAIAQAFGQGLIARRFAVEDVFG